MTHKTHSEHKRSVIQALMSALAGAHDAAVQMIDTSIVRVHQQGACITQNRRQSMGRSRGGLCVVDANACPSGSR